MPNSNLTIDEMRKMGTQEIDKEISKSKMELLKIKLQTSSQNSKETHLIKQLKNHIARLQTVKNESKSN